MQIRLQIIPGTQLLETAIEKHELRRNEFNFETHSRGYRYSLLNLLLLFCLPGEARTSETARRTRSAIKGNLRIIASEWCAPS